METNLASVFFSCTEVGRHMRERGAGSIINIASLAAHRGFQLSALYTMSKRADAHASGGMGNPNNGPPPRLSSEHKAKVAEWLEQGPDFERDGAVRWRCVDLQKWITPIATTAGSLV